MENKPLVLAIDDDTFYLEETRFEVAPHAEVKLFQGPNDFEENVSEADIDRASIIIVDYDYGSGTAVKSDVAGYLRHNLGYRGKLVLCSLLEHFGEYDMKVRKEYDFVLHKRDLCWKRLFELL